MLGVCLAACYGDVALDGEGNSGLLRLWLAAKRLKLIGGILLAAWAQGYAAAATRLA